MRLCDRHASKDGIKGNPLMQIHPNWVADRDSATDAQVPLFGDNE